MTLAALVDMEQPSGRSAVFLDIALHLILWGLTLSGLTLAAPNSAPMAAWQPPGSPIAPCFSGDR